MKIENGQGMIEVLATFLIIVISISGLIYFQNNMAYANNLTQQEQTALMLATNQIETLRDFSTLTGTNSYQSMASGSSVNTNGNATYSINWTVTTATNPNYKTMSVVVSWTDRRNTSQSLNLISRIGGVDPVYSGIIME
jgi:Tfp pilus assembly protein PilV